jgi:leader peptidase (prepilin peptidase)/N-methyltransferase
MVWVASPLELFLSAVLGLVLGSFATALVYRVPAGVSWHAFFGAQKRSACVHCGTNLAIKDLVPLLSWLSLKGRCRYCGGAIGVVYPAIELSVMLAALLFVGAHGFFPLEQRLPALAVFPFLAALIVIDFRTRLLPNALVFAVAALGALHLAAVVWHADMILFPIYEYAGGAFFYGLIALILSISMEKLLKKPALGGGDIKLMAALGLWLGLSNLAAFFMLSGALGVVLGAIWCRIRGDEAFPFGPALIAAFFVLFCL